MLFDDVFLEYLHERLPDFYRDEDRNIGNPLYRYLKALSYGGFSSVLVNANNFIDLLNPSACPVELLPYFFSSLGIPYYPELPEKYSRRILQNAGNLYKRKGTASALQYLARELSGFDTSEIIIGREGTPTAVTRRFAIIQILVMDEEDPQLFTAQDVINRYIQEFLPLGIEGTLVVVYGFTDSVVLTLTESEDMVDSIIEVTPYPMPFANTDEDEVAIAENTVEAFGMQNLEESFTNDFGSLTNSTLFTNLPSNHFDIITYS